MHEFRNVSRIAGLIFLSAVGSALGCSAQVGGTPGSASQTVAVDVTPNAVEVAPSGTTQFAAAVTGTIDTGVTWSVVEGTTGGAIDQNGNYVAPTGTGTFHVRAVAHADTNVSASAVVTVTAAPAISVSISPRTTSVTAGGTATFTATVANDATSSGVTYTASCGSITAGGVFTAPSTAGTCTVTATSKHDTTKSAAATVTVTVVTPIVVTLNNVAPAVDACKTFSFTATVTGTTNTAVTWSVVEGTTGGSVTTGGVYTAPSSAGTYHVRATSSASATSVATATVTVTERIVSVAVSPTTASLTSGGTQQFAATVTTTCGAFVATGP
jgi:hypothetical protein